MKTKLAILAAVLGLSACGVQYDPTSGTFAVVADPKAIADVSQRLIDRLNERLEEEQLDAPVIPVAKAVKEKGTSKSGLVLP